MKQDAGLYVHIPFCDHKCIYCDFYSIIKDDNKTIYLKNLLNEINHFSSIYSTFHQFKTIYFEGHPSLMEPEYLGSIISHLKSKFQISEDAEITMETNPGTVSFDKLKRFREQGINRISIGTQSLTKKT
ncbi:MAG: radical SAM protein [Ignavibacteriales bacterium]|nr:radical SAM protein [Ignavibacteriales bacterium]